MGLFYLIKYSGTDLSSAIAMNEVPKEIIDSYFQKVCEGSLSIYRDGDGGVTNMLAWIYKAFPQNGHYAQLFTESLKGCESDNI